MPRDDGTLEFFYNISSLLFFLYLNFKRIVMAAIVILNLFQDAKTYLNTRKIVMAGTGPRKMRKHFLGGFGPP